MYGSIAGIDEKTVLIDVGNNVKIKFDRSAINILAQQGKEAKEENKKNGKK